MEKTKTSHRSENRIDYADGIQLIINLTETNIAPENGWLEDEIPFGDGLCSGAFAVSFRGNL